MGIIYSYNPEKIVKVSISSIKYLTTQLSDFLEIYGKKVLMLSDEEREAYNRLIIISNLLKEKRYGELFVNPYFVVDFDDDNDDYLPEYLPL